MNNGNPLSSNTRRPLLKDVDNLIVPFRVTFILQNPSCLSHASFKFYCCVPQETDLGDPSLLIQQSHTDKTIHDWRNHKLQYQHVLLLQPYRPHSRPSALPLLSPRRKQTEPTVATPPPSTNSHALRVTMPLLANTTAISSTISSALGHASSHQTSTISEKLSSSSGLQRCEVRTSRSG